MSDSEANIGQQENVTQRIKTSAVQLDSKRNQLLGKIIPHDVETDLQKLQGVEAFFRLHSFSTQEKEQLLHSSSELLQNMLDCSPTDEGDPMFTRQVYNFLVNFPGNIYNHLQKIASADTTARIIQMGTAIIKKDESLKETDLVAVHLKNFTLSQLCNLVGNDVPNAVLAQDENHASMLETMEAGVAVASDVGELVKYVDYYKIAGKLSAEENARIRQFETNISRLDSSYTNHENSLTKLRNELWALVGRSSGIEKRIPRWADMGVLVRTTEVANHEYGIAITKQEGDESEIQFVGGGQHGIENTRRPKNTIFIHSHPSRSMEHYLRSPLISFGDLDATMFNDGGGGYLNVVNLNGLTLYVGKTKETAHPRTNTFSRDKIIYKVSSGELKGILISEIGSENNPTKTLDTMVELRKMGKSYVYSVDDGISTYRFLHVPWELMDPTISVNELCFGDGLSQLLQNIDDLPSEMVIHRNLREALIVSESSAL